MTSHRCRGVAPRLSTSRLVQRLLAAGHPAGCDELRVDVAVNGLPCRDTGTAGAISDATSAMIESTTNCSIRVNPTRDRDQTAMHHVMPICWPGCLARLRLQGRLRLSTSPESAGISRAPRVRYCGPPAKRYCCRRPRHDMLADSAPNPPPQLRHQEFQCLE